VRRAARRTIVLIGGIVAAILLAPAAASAHPLGNFTINLYSGISVVPHGVHVHYAVDMAEIPTYQETQQRIDANGDGTATEAEQQAWAHETAPQLLSQVHLSVGGVPVKLSVDSAGMYFHPGQGGLNVLRLDAEFSGSAPTSGSVRYADDNYRDHIGWREITALGADGEAVRNSSVPVSSVSDELRAYPANLLQSPLHVTEATFSFVPGESNVVATGSVDSSGARPGVIGGSFAALVDRSGLSATVVALCLLLAIGFGALHAILPGHGKTLMAAYLVGAGGRIRHAVSVGVAVSLMHTVSVIALGLVVLYAESVFPRPEDVYPWLGLLSGVVVIALGTGLFVVRYRARRRTATVASVSGQHDHPLEGHDHDDHDHDHDRHDHDRHDHDRHDHDRHDHDRHDHALERELVAVSGPSSGSAEGSARPVNGLAIASSTSEEPHTHGGSTHVHPVPDGPVLSRKGLTALALAGGILPSPTAVIVLVAGVAIHRVPFALGLIVAFSVGLAAALIIVGVAALSARDLVSRKMSSRVGQILPLLSALAIAGVGAFLLIRSISQL
jgi:nickel/cobalt transporter (NicO) family protein